MSDVFFEIPRNSDRREAVGFNEDHQFAKIRRRLRNDHGSTDLKDPSFVRVHTPVLSIASLLSAETLGVASPLSVEMDRAGCDADLVFCLPFSFGRCGVLMH